MSEPWREVGDRVFVRRHASFDLNVGLVVGDGACLVVDTRCTLAEGRDLVAAVRTVTSAPWEVVATHAHFDHCFGNGAFRAAYGEVPIHAHEVAATETAAAAERIRDACADDPDDPHRSEVLETEVVPADHTFSSARVLDLGDRVVELVHPGRGHTAGDLVVRVPDVDVLLAGDAVEESGPPMYGDDSWPMEWPLSLDVVLGLSTASTVVVPGHGAPVDRDFVEQQRNEVGIVAETIRDLAGRGVPVSQALEEGDWPWDAERLRQAVARGYDHLPRAQKRLPLI